MSSRIKRLLNRWRSQPGIAENLVEWRLLAAKPADDCPFPDALASSLVSALNRLGIKSLYRHQALAYEKVRAGENIAVVSGTASGKTLCYNLPVIDRMIQQPTARALYVYPTKALAQDQLSNLGEPSRFWKARSAA